MRRWPSPCAEMSHPAPSSRNSACPRERSRSIPPKTSEPLHRSGASRYERPGWSNTSSRENGTERLMKGHRRWTKDMASDSMKAKIVLLGDGGVGKTSLIRRFVVDQYSDEYIATIGTKVSKRSLSLGHPAAEVEMAMQIWDVLGQKGYSGVQETAMKGAQGVLHGLRCDGRREPSELGGLLDARRVATRRPRPDGDRRDKADLVADRVWAEDYLYFLGQKYTCPAILTSARTGERVEPAFKSLGEQILQGAGHPVRRIVLVTPPQRTDRSPRPGHGQDHDRFLLR